LQKKSGEALRRKIDPAKSSLNRQGWEKEIRRLEGAMRLRGS
jgi:hypothetical protein